MPVRLYFNHNVNRAVTQGLRLRGVDLLTAFEDRAHRLSDSELLDRATSLDRVLFSNDRDLVIEARRRQSSWPGRRLLLPPYPARHLASEPL